MNKKRSIHIYVLYACRPKTEFQGELKIATTDKCCAQMHIYQKLQSKNQSSMHPARSVSIIFLQRDHTLCHCLTDGIVVLNAFERHHEAEKAIEQNLNSKDKSMQIMVFTFSFVPNMTLLPSTSSRFCLHQTHRM